MPKTKIIATLGPASCSPPVLRKMIMAGLDVVRLNFSHGTPREKLAMIKTVRLLNRKMRRHIRILGDLEGYRIRVDSLPHPVELRRNQIFYLPLDYKGNLSVIKDGQEIFIDDGNLAVVVEGRRNGRLKTRVTQGGLLKEHKGINIPGAHFEFKGLTAKDRVDIDFCVEHKLDFIAQSFVRSADDILAVRRALGKSRIGIIDKIENDQGVRNAADIIKVSDGLMVARGDLGVSLPIYEVPLLQKELIRKCRLAKIFSITATQMLESMTGHRRPTRAEVSDVANAVLDGSDYLMLSAETAVGEYPVEAVRMMNRTISFTEEYIKSARAIQGRA